MTLLGTDTYTVTRNTGSYVDGVWVDNAPTVFTIVASVQPLMGEDVERLPEGARSDRVQAIYADRRQPVLRASFAGSGTRSDEIAIDGDTYEIMHRENWTRHKTGVPHWRYIAMRTNPEEVP